VCECSLGGVCSLTVFGRVALVNDVIRNKENFVCVCVFSMNALHLQAIMR
jgi:hypothetical protein